MERELQNSLIWYMSFCISWFLLSDFTISVDTIVSSFFLSLFPSLPVAIGWRLVGDWLGTLLAIISWYLSQLLSNTTLKLLVVFMAISLVDCSFSSDVLIWLSVNQSSSDSFFLPVTRLHFFTGVHLQFPSFMFALSSKWIKRDFVGVSVYHSQSSSCLYIFMYHSMRFALEISVQEAEIVMLPPTLKPLNTKTISLRALQRKYIHLSNNCNS